MVNKKKFDYHISPLFVLKAMIYTNIFMFAVSLFFSMEKVPLSLNPLRFLTPGIGALKFLGATGKSVISDYGNWWSLISANWLHGSLLHILFNMLALRTLVPLVVKEFGISRMFSLYTLSGICGFALSYYGNVYLTIGASSGICGLVGAAFYFGKSRGGQWGLLVYKQTTGWVISLALFGFFIPNINNWSHAGGLVSGIFLAWIFGYTEKRKENIIDKIFAFFLMLITLWLLLSAVFQAFILKFS